MILAPKTWFQMQLNTVNQMIILDVLQNAMFIGLPCEKLPFSQEMLVLNTDFDQNFTGIAPFA